MAEPILVEVEPKAKRKVSFLVSEQEAEQIHSWLKDALDSNVNSPWPTDRIRQIMYGFQQASK